MQWGKLVCALIVIINMGLLLTRAQATYSRGEAVYFNQERGIITPIPSNGLPQAKDAETVIAEIYRQSKKHSIDFEVAERISWCESRHNPFAKNPNSTASGIYQITRDTFEDAIRLHFIDYTWHDVMNKRKNIEVAMWYMMRDEFWRWGASIDCWKYEKKK